MIVSKKMKFIIVLLAFSVSLVAQSNRKPVPNPKLDKAKEALDSLGLPGAEKTAKSAPGAEMDKPSTSSETEGTVIYVNAGTFFEISSADDATNVDYVEYKINNGEFQKYSNPINITEEGKQTIIYRAVDKVGNKETAKLLTVVVDNTPPTVKMLPSEVPYTRNNVQYISNRTTYSIAAEDNSSGVKKIEYFIDNGPKQRYTEGSPIKLETPGAHIISFFATDNSGNVTPEYGKMLVNVDVNRPTIRIVESSPYVVIGGRNYAKKDTSFAVKAFDNESGISQVLIKVDGASDFSPYAEPIVFTSQGEHTIEAKAIDNVGNESEIVSVTVLTDVNPPTTTIRAISKED
jgi:hypothetical protein